MFLDNFPHRLRVLSCARRRLLSSLRCAPLVSGGAAAGRLGLARGRGHGRDAERGLRILVALDEVAAGHAATPAQVALAWLIARPSVTAPIVSATSVAQLAELLKATSLTLDESAIKHLNAASD